MRKFDLEHTCAFSDDEEIIEEGTFQHEAQNSWFSSLVWSVLLPFTLLGYIFRYLTSFTSTSRRAGRALPPEYPSRTSDRIRGLEATDHGLPETVRRRKSRDSDRVSETHGETDELERSDEQISESIESSWLGVLLKTVLLPFTLLANVFYWLTRSKSRISRRTLPPEFPTRTSDRIRGHHATDHGLPKTVRRRRSRDSDRVSETHAESDEHERSDEPISECTESSWSVA